MSRYERAQSFLKKLVPAGLVLVSTVVALLLGELFVRIVVNPGDFLPATLIDDPALGHRIKPHTTGHDALGFRNAVVPDQASIIAIGDSMTYGFGVTRDGNWPSQLGSLLNKPVYNMALGGYGPLQYLYLAQHEAKKLRPSLLIVGFYFGNDFIDAYRVANQIPFWSGWRPVGPSAESDAEYYRVADAEPKKRFAELRNWLYHHSVLYSMLRVTVLVRFASWEREGMASQVAPDRQMMWVDPSNQAVRAIFTPQLILSALDPRLPSVRKGFRITTRAFSTMKGEAIVQGAQMLVVLIPTRERAYCDYIKSSSDQLPRAFAMLCDAEDQMKAELVKFFVIEEIAHVDTTAALEDAVRKHVPIYPEADGHPLESGQQIIAHVASDAVNRMQKHK